MYLGGVSYGYWDIRVGNSVDWCSSPSFPHLLNKDDVETPQPCVLGGSVIGLNAQMSVKQLEILKDTKGYPQ